MDPTDQLRAVAIPLAGADPSLPEDDLAPLLERLAGARLIGLGEATHGDHESFAFKCRLIQALVRRGHCDVVIFERGVAEMDAYDRYVTGADDDLPMGNELYPWQVEEVRDLFVWLRAWNAGHAPDDAVRVAGMDMQSPAGLPLALRLLGEVGTAAPAVWRRLAAEADERKRDLPWLEAALATWQETAPPPLDRSDPHQRWIALLARTFGQWLEVWPYWLTKEPPWRYYELRDRCMAENTLAQSDRLRPGGRAAIWAHNFHVWLGPAKVGCHLRADLGPAYRSVGFAFGRGQINAGSSKVNAETKAPEGPFDWTLRPQTTESPAAGSMEDALDQLDLDAYAIAPADIEAFRQPLRMREIGAAVVENLSQFTQNQVVPADVFDLLVYFREVQPSRLLGTTA
jgi:erythromycin esterase